MDRETAKKADLDGLVPVELDQHTPKGEGSESDKNSTLNYHPPESETFEPRIIHGEEYVQSRGVNRMENVAYFAKHGGRVGKTTYYLIGASVLVCMFVVSHSDPIEWISWVVVNGRLHY